jgi:hypothetical protein
MTPPPTERHPRSSFARLAAREARGVLVATGLFAVLCAAVTFSPLRKGNAHKAPRGANDIALYRAVVERIAQGENYYAASGQEMRPRGYPTSSVFNWRAPGLTWLIAVLPDLSWSRAILAVVTLATTLLLTMVIYREAGALAAALAGVMLVGSLMLGILGDSVVMPTIWAGAFVAASLAAYGIERRGWGVALGMAALLMRELAGPYCAGALVLALWQRRWKEAAAWAAGIALFAAYYAWHIAQVRMHQLPTDTMHDGSWLQGGGLAMVISLAQVHAYLIVLPQWIAAIYLAFAMLGAASARTDWTTRVALSLAGYVALFGVVGYDFNQYWGVLIAPLFAIAAALAPRALVDSWQASWRSANDAVGAIAPSMPAG